MRFRGACLLWHPGWSAGGAAAAGAAERCAVWPGGPPSGSPLPCWPQAALEAAPSSPAAPRSQTAAAPSAEGGLVVAGKTGFWFNGGGFVGFNSTVRPSQCLSGMPLLLLCLWNLLFRTYGDLMENYFLE